MIDRQVDLKVGTKAYALIPTLGAMTKINRALGSPRDALERVSRCDFDAICNVVAAGADVSAKKHDELREEVFAAGAVNMIVPVMQYLRVLMDPNDSEEAAPEEGKA